jgi:hypothetical protein
MRAGAENHLCQLLLNSSSGRERFRRAQILNQLRLIIHLKSPDSAEVAVPA